MCQECQKNQSTSSYQQPQVINNQLEIKYFWADISMPLEIAPNFELRPFIGNDNIGWFRLK